MRPMRPVLALVVVLLAPAALLAGTSGPPPPPDGPFFFVDQKSFDKITSLANIDQAFNEFCLAGRAVFIDASTTLNHRVEIGFSSLGSIDKESSSKVDGLFTTVNLTLTVYDGPSPTTANVLFDGAILGADCKLDGSLLKEGNADRVQLNCDVGANLSDFGKLSQEVLDSITFATAKKKTISVNVKTGKLSINHVGVPMPEGFNSTLVCPTSSDSED